MTNSRSPRMSWLAAVAVAVATVLTVTAGAATASTAAAPPRPADGTDAPTAAVRGEARLAYLPSPDDEIRVSVDAHATFADPHTPFPTEVGGTAYLSHHFVHAQPQPITVWVRIAVDCLMTGGPTATVTGIVVEASPEAQDWLNLRLGFSVYDGGGSRDRVGFSGPPRPGEPQLPSCMAPAGHFTVQDGGFTVTDDLP